MANKFRASWFGLGIREAVRMFKLSDDASHHTFSLGKMFIVQGLEGVYTKRRPLEPKSRPVNCHSKELTRHQSARGALSQ